MSENLDGLRRDVGKHLEDLIETDKFSPRLVAAHVPKLNYKKIYRWLGSPGFFAPPLKDCEGILDFIKKVEKVKSDFSDIVTSWNDDRYSRITLLGLFSYAYLQILENKTLTLDAKIARLTLLVFRDWARAKAKAAK